MAYINLTNSRISFDIPQIVANIEQQMEKTVGGDAYDFLCEELDFIINLYEEQLKEFSLLEDELKAKDVEISYLSDKIDKLQ